MRMRFGVDEDDAFHACVGRLLDGFAGWLDENELVAEPMAAELLLQYKWLAGDGDLSHWSLEHVETFLDGWCPRVMAEHHLPLRLVPVSVAVFTEYLDESGLLSGGPRPSQIRRLCLAYTDEYDELESRPIHPVLEEFDAPPDPVRIPGPADRAASAAASTILHDARVLARWCGDGGRVLTRTGRLRVADARHLAEELGTGDLEVHPGHLDRSDRLQVLTWILETSVAAGALRRDNGRLVAVTKFAELDDTTAHEDLVLAARDTGVLTVRGARRAGDDDGWPGALLDPGPPDDHVPDLVVDGLPDDQIDVPEPADDATPAFLALLRHPTDGMAYADLIALLGLVLGWSSTDGPQLTVSSTQRLVDRVQRLGLVELSEVVTEYDEDLRVDLRTGGRIVLTPAGVACALLVLSGENLEFPTRPDPAVATVAEIVDLAGEVPPEEWRCDIDVWHAAQADPARAIAEFVARALAPEQPLVVVLTATSVAAERFGAEVVDDLLREHLDGPHRAQVARRLVARGVVAPDVVEPEVLLNASVDVLAVTIDTIDVDEWPALFAREFPAGELGAFDFLWQLDNPRLGDVLAELGEHHPDAAVATAARRARTRWQSRTGGR